MREGLREGVGEGGSGEGREYEHKVCGHDEVSIAMSLCRVCVVSASCACGVCVICVWCMCGVCMCVDGCCDGSCEEVQVEM